MWQQIRLESMRFISLHFFPQFITNCNSLNIDKHCKAGTERYGPNVDMHCKYVSYCCKLFNATIHAICN